VFLLQITDIHKIQTPLIRAIKNTDQNRNFFNHGSGKHCGRLEAPVVTQRRRSMRLEDIKLTVTFLYLLVILINTNVDQSIAYSLTIN